jgi:glycosyltransferase involved in cell wall biosynthesis
VTLRIAITADPELPVPPTLYGGIERVIDLLVRELVGQGCEVTLFANPASQSAGTLIPWTGANSQSKIDTVRNAATLAGAVARGRFDIVHSFSRIAYLTPILPSRLPKLMTYQRQISRRTVALGQQLSGGTLAFSGISDWMIQEVKDIGRWFVVPNGVPIEVYDFAPHVATDAPLVFLGRIEEIKGPHLAIEVARRSGRRLVIAGNIPPEHQGWYEEQVAPHIDGQQITYVGPVDDAQKNRLLGSAAAFLMPILWEEPFGIVMAEALACGTPVVGLRRGAVPEVVREGTGFVVETVDELVAAVGQLGQIDRAACRRRAETVYSGPAITRGYLDVYRQLIGR